MISGISDRAVFARLRSEGLHVRSADMRLRFELIEANSSQLDQTQVAYSISRKVGSAVVRNRIRRRLRSLLTEHLGVDGSPPLSAALVIVLPGARERTYAELQEQVLELMKKAEKSAKTSS